MNPCLKMEEKCNKSVNKEFKIMRKSNNGWANNETKVW